MLLPQGLQSRPLTAADAIAVHRLLAAEESASFDRVEIDLADVIADWQRPSFDPQASTIGVFAAGELIGFAEHTGRDRAELVWDPGLTDPAVGTWLAQWLADLVRGHGGSAVTVSVPLGGASDRLLGDLGFLDERRAWGLELGAGTLITPRALPPGYVLREAPPERYAQVHTVIDEAFLEWADRPPRSFEEFRATVLERPGHQLWMVRVVLAPDGSIAAAAALNLTDDGQLYVSHLATRADHRHRGLAQALLHDCLLAGHEHGATALRLNTNSRTGALDLYRKLGMVITSTWVERSLTL